jgi:hypothetical protein
MRISSVLAAVWLLAAPAIPVSAGPPVSPDSTCGRFPASWECRFQANCALFSRDYCAYGMTGEQAENLLVGLSEDGDRTAAGFVALAYEAGIGIERNLTKALYFYRRAIDLGSESTLIREGYERTRWILNGGTAEGWFKKHGAIAEQKG